MFEIINVIVISFVSDLLIALSIKRLFDLEVNFCELLFVQIIMLAPTMVYVFCGWCLLLLLLLKLVSGIFLCVLITDSFKFGFLCKLYACYVLLMFSIYGFSEFMILLVSSCAKMVTGEAISKNWSAVMFLAVLFYVMVVGVFSKKMSCFKKLKPYLANVSFLLFGKHIEMVGLLDSGNSLIDDVTKKPVVVVSVSVIKHYFKDIEIDDFEKIGFCERLIDCVSAGGIKFKMPIVDIGSICVKTAEHIKSFDCVVGFVRQEFYDEKHYQCLIHRNCC